MHIPHKIVIDEIRRLIKISNFDPLPVEHRKLAMQSQSGLNSMKKSYIYTVRVAGLKQKNGDLTQDIFQTNLQTYSGILLPPTCKRNYEMILLAND